MAQEALAIALTCALRADDPIDGILLAVNHSGDSDSTGAITGNILGALHAASVIPAGWLEGLELVDVTTRMADDLAEAFYGHGVSSQHSANSGVANVVARYR